MEDSLREKKRRAREVLKRIRAIYGDPGIELIYTDPYQLLVAVILSAQSTDKKVNEITPSLFSRFPTIRAMAGAREEDLIPYIRQIGLYRAKAKNIISCCRQIVRRFGGRIPDTMEDLVSLPGIGRKSANVLLANLYGQDTITVDTHVKRLSYRLGFTDNTDPTKIEYDLMEIWPKGNWTTMSNGLILHGRRRCKARNPDCEGCEFRDVCPKIGVEARDGR